METITLKVHRKGITKGQNKVKTMEVPCSSDVSNVKELLVELVKYSVEQYCIRKENAEMLKTLTESEIKEKEKTGKISFGVNYGDKTPDLEYAIENAIQNYEDGVVVLFVNNKKTSKLEETLELKEGTEITLIKLTMFAGRMW